MAPTKRASTGGGYATTTGATSAAAPAKDQTCLRIERMEAEREERRRTMKARKIERAAEEKRNIAAGNPGDVDTYTLQFNTPGSVCYVCEPHVALNMIGTITVEAVGPTVPTMGEWGLIAMGLLFVAFGSYTLLKRHRLAVAVNQ